MFFVFILCQYQLVFIFFGKEFYVHTPGTGKKRGDDVILPRFFSIIKDKSEMTVVFPAPPAPLSVIINSFSENRSIKWWMRLGK